MKPAARIHEDTIRNPGLDRITEGGLPEGRITIVSGEPGLGKTLLSLQFLCAGADDRESGGLFVAFEESTADIIRNADGFGWNTGLVDPDVLLPERGSEAQIRILAANPSADLVQAGEFDLGGLLAVVTGLVEASDARRVVFDGIDVLLDLLDSPALRRQEILRLRDWVLASGVTAIVTSKPLARTETSTGYEFLHYIADGLLVLRRRICGRSSMRTLEVVKLRGSGHSTSQHPFTISSRGLVIGDAQAPTLDFAVSSEVVTSGVPSLDTMLGGGYLKGSSILVSGAPGTAKTTLCGSFLEAACQRGERGLYISFDEPPGQIERNLLSVGIDFGSHHLAGRLVTVGYRTGRLGPEEQFQRIVETVMAAEPQAVVIDPISALSPVVQEDFSGHLAERIIDFLKARSVTVLLTSLLEGPAAAEEKARAQVSGIADTWIHLSFAIRNGERNRALTIIKSRGFAHSNQVRELLLSKDGLKLTQPYAATGEVLMGSARLEREQADEAEALTERLQFEARQAEMLHAESRARRQLEAAEAEIDALRLQRLAMEESERARSIEQQRSRAARLVSRGTVS